MKTKKPTFSTCCFMLLGLDFHIMETMASLCPKCTVELKRWVKNGRPYWGGPGWDEKYSDDYPGEVEVIK